MTNALLDRTVLPVCPSFIGSDNNSDAHMGPCKDLDRHVLVKTRCSMRLVHLVMLGYPH